MNNPLDPNDLPQDIQSNIPNDDDDTKSPSRQDEDWKEDPESDDDVDELGEEVGVTYSDTEDIDITKKVPVTTPSEPPSEE